MSLYIDDALVGTIDMFFASSNYGYSSISNISVANTGSHKIEFRVDTTTATLGDRYVMVWHYAGFTRTGNVA